MSEYPRKLLISDVIRLFEEKVGVRGINKSECSKALEEYTKQIRAEAIEEFVERVAKTDINTSNFPMNQVNLLKMQMLKEQE